MTDRLLILSAQADLYFGGSGTLQGTVTENGVPGKYRVRLYAQDTGLLARETWSDPVTGHYEFRFLNTTREFFLVAFDHTATITNAAIRDHGYAATPATVVNLALGGAAPAAACPYPLTIAAYSPPPGACPYTLRIGAGESYTGTLAATLDDAVAALAGGTREPTTGTLTVTLAGATPVFNTNVLPPVAVIPAPITATWTATLASDTPAVSATAHPAGRLITTLGSDVAAGEATYTTLNKATIAYQLPDALVVMAGTHGEPPDVFLQANLASDVCVATGLVVYDVTATVAITLEDASASMTAQQPYRAEWNGVLAEDVIALFAAAVPVVIGAEAWRIVDQGSLTGDLLGMDAIALGDSGSGLIALSLTSTESMTLADGGELKAYLLSSDRQALTDSGTVILRSDAVENITLTDSGSALLAATATGADTLALLESATLTAWRVTSETVTITDAGNVAAMLVGADTLSITDTAGLAVALLATSTDTISLADSGDYRADRTATDTVALADTGAVASAATLIGTDTFAWTESGTGILDQALLSGDAIALLDTGATVLAVTLDSADGFVVHEQWGVVGGTLDTGACWVLNADTLAVTRYTGLPFRQVAMFGTTALAVGPNGLYRLTGSTDQSAAITAQLETGLHDFDTALLKRMPNATLDYSLDDDLTLTITWLDATGTRQSETYTVAQELQGKVKLGRGIRFRWRKLTITGTAPWSLLRIDEYPELLSRRLGG